METLVSISYWVCGIGLGLCALSYFIIPKVVRLALKDEEETEES